MKEKTDKEIERIYLKIQKDWNLTGKITKDFVIVAIQEFNQENDFATSTVKTYMRKNPHARFDEHIVIDILRIAIRRIAAGLEETKKENKTECLFETMVSYINYDIEKEGEHQRKMKELDADLEKLHKKKKKSLNKIGGEK